MAQIVQSEKSMIPLWKELADHVPDLTLTGQREREQVFQCISEKLVNENKKNTNKIVQNNSQSGVSDKKKNHKIKNQIIELKVRFQ